MRVKTDAKRDEIVRIARPMFLAEGYSATSMAAIAARVGGSKATLYGYFKSKEELFSAVVQAVAVENLVPILEGLENEEADFVEALDNIALALVRFFLLPDAMVSYRLAIAESARFPELGRAFYDNGRKRGRLQIEAWLDKQVKKGCLRSADTEIMAEQLVALCEIGPARQIMLGADLSPDEADVERLARGATDMFMAAYGVARQAQGASPERNDLRPGRSR